MEETVLDLQGKELETLTAAEIPQSITSAVLSNNNFTVLPEDLFQKTTKIWRIDLSRNRLTDLSFMSSIKALEYLDISHNDLMADELLQINHIHVIFLKASSNGFHVAFNDHPIIMVCLLKRAWVIDGIFISDFARRSSDEFKGTIAFGETINAARRERTSEGTQMGPSQAAATFLAGSSCKFTDPGLYISPKGSYIQQLSTRPQIERLKFLLNCFPVDLPQGTFVDYFSIALGILSHQWLDLPLEDIPRLLSRAYWGLVSEKIQNSEDWELWLILLKITELIRTDQIVEQELWLAMKVSQYIQTGEPPVIGATPRLLLAALLFRAVDPEDLQDCKDITIYKKYRENCGFKSLDEDLNVIHAEILGAFPEGDSLPVKGETLAIIHPLTDRWMNCKISQVKNGRVISELPDCIVQFPNNVLFWDGRGMWRQAKSRESGIKVKGKRAKSAMVVRLSEQAKKAFITASATLQHQQQQATENVSKTFSETLLSSKHVPPTLVVNKNIRLAPADGSEALKKTLLPSMKHLTRTIDFKTTAKPVATLPPTFRGIPDPRLPERHRIARVAPSRRTTQVVEDVVNITFGQEIAYGRHLRRFHVRVKNELTNRLSYIWINEDEVPVDDVKRLCDIYRAHIEEKMTVVKPRSPTVKTHIHNGVLSLP